MKAWSRMAMFVAGLGIAAAALAAPNLPTRPIEQKHYADGPWAAAQTFTPAGCDAKGNPCDIYYPGNLGANGFKHPIVVWGNGTGDTPIAATTYAYLLRHLATWGFVVIATRDGSTGVGGTLIDSANYLVAQNGNPNSVFYGKLNTARIGAMGHSQGATGAINAMLKSKGLIRTAVSFHIAQQAYCNPADNCVLTADLKAARGGSIFYISGTADWLVSPDKQLLGSQLNSNTAYYNATPVALAKAKAILKGPNHNDVQGNPTCARANSPCTNGVHSYLGYPTAWLMWQLQGAADGRDAVKGSGGEIFGETTSWQSVVSNIP